VKKSIAAICFCLLLISAYSIGQPADSIGSFNDKLKGSNSDTAIILNEKTWKNISEGLDYSEEPEKEIKPKDDGKKFDLGNLPSISPTVLKIIAYSLIVGFIIFLLIKLDVVELIRDLIKPKNESKKDEIAEIQEQRALSAELFSEALKEKDQKLSLKLVYLACLHYLGEVEILKIRKETTNLAYVRALSGLNIQPSFRKIVTAHELTWFGERTVSDNEYGELVETARRILQFKR
jgi:hypothetical protein